MGSFLDRLLLGYKTVLRNATGGLGSGTVLPPRTVLNFIGFSSVVDNPVLGSTDITASSGGSGLVIQNNGSVLPGEPSLNFIGFSAVDNSALSRTDVTNPDVQSVTLTSGGVLVMGSNLITRVSFIAGDAITFPVTPVPGLPILLFHDLSRSTTSLSSSRVTFQRPGGAAYTFEQPDGQKTGGSPIFESPTHVFTDNARYIMFHDGGSPGVYRCAHSVNSP
jgi:hypothetical protein